VKASRSIKILVEVAELPAARQPDVPSTQRVLEFGHHAELVELAVGAFRAGLIALASI
jgi:hypothetical protein